MEGVGASDTGAIFLKQFLARTELRYLVRLSGREVAVEPKHVLLPVVPQEPYSPILMTMASRPC